MIASTLVVFFLCYANTGAEFEGQTCRVPATRQDGRCIPVEQCEYAKRLLQQGKNPQTCGFAGFSPLVCCPISQNVAASKPGTLSGKMCSEYFRKGDFGIAVDLGEAAKPKEFPHMAAIGYDDVNSNLWLCGGSLISHYFVLSAAHCVSSAEYGSARRVRLGDIFLKNTTAYADPVVVAIAETYVHPSYKTSSHYHDISLFRLATKINFTPYIKAACLQTMKNIPVNMLEATGWGRLGLFGDTSQVLMKVTLSVVDHRRCARKYMSIRKLQNGILDQSQICAGDSAGKDTCPGDSGGPLHYNVEEVNRILRHFVIAGVTSFGKGCGGENSIGVYTRVSSYVGWIEGIAWQGKYN